MYHAIKATTIPCMRDMKERGRAASLVSSRQASSAHAGFAEYTEESAAQVTKGAAHPAAGAGQRGQDDPVEEAGCGGHGTRGSHHGELREARGSISAD